MAFSPATGFEGDVIFESTTDAVHASVVYSSGKREDDLGFARTVFRLALIVCGVVVVVAVVMVVVVVVVDVVVSAPLS